MRLPHTSLTGAEPFSTFVKPRLAVGPAKQKLSGAASSRLMLLGVDDTADTALPAPDFSKIVKLAPGETAEVVIPVTIPAPANQRASTVKVAVMALCHPPMRRTDGRPL
jgi:hypothetical protein